MVFLFLDRFWRIQRDHACHRIRYPGGLSSSWTWPRGRLDFGSVGRICQSFLRRFAGLVSNGLAGRLRSDCGKYCVIVMVISFCCGFGFGERAFADGHRVTLRSPVEPDPVFGTGAASLYLPAFRSECQERGVRYQAAAHHAPDTLHPAPRLNWLPGLDSHQHHAV